MEVERSYMPRTRTHEIHLRLNDKEYQALKRNSAKCNLPQQTYIRKLIKEVTPREAPSGDFWPLYHELNKMNIELGTISRIARDNGIIDTDTFWTQVKMFNKKTVDILHAMTFPEWVVQEVDANRKCTKLEYKSRDICK